jgi:hypothetical protein
MISSFYSFWLTPFVILLHYNCLKLRLLWLHWNIWEVVDISQEIVMMKNAENDNIYMKISKNVCFCKLTGIYYQGFFSSSSETSDNNGFRAKISCNDFLGTWVPGSLLKSCPVEDMHSFQFSDLV